MEQKISNNEEASDKQMDTKTENIITVVWKGREAAMDGKQVAFPEQDLDWMKKYVLEPSQKKPIVLAMIRLGESKEIIAATPIINEFINRQTTVNQDSIKTGKTE